MSETDYLCDVCEETITADRYKCTSCRDYDVCSEVSVYTVSGNYFRLMVVFVSVSVTLSLDQAAHMTQAAM